MVKIHTVRRVTAFVFAFGILAFSNARAQEWLRFVEPPSDTVTFFSLKNSFEEWKKTVDFRKTKGWKQFQRWAWFWEQRISPSGEFPKAGHYLRETQKFRTNEQNNTFLGGNEWTALGPFTRPAGKGENPSGMGRINCVRINPMNSANIWIGSAGGGAWFSLDSGATWQTTTDFLPTLGVGDIAFDPVNPSIIYLGTGDRMGLSAGFGVGVMKSTNGGQTWNVAWSGQGTISTENIQRIQVNPVNTNIIYCSTSGGIYKSTDAGATWVRKVIGNYSDLELKPNNPEILYAALYGSAKIVRSTDGGETWKSAYTPTGCVRIALAVSKTDPEFVIALAANNSRGFAGLFASEDDGATWAKISSKPNILANDPTGSAPGGQGEYDLALALSPLGADRIFTGGINIWRSLNYGGNWKLIADWLGALSPYVHADIHDLNFDPKTGYLYAGCDGGIFVSKDGGDTWKDLSDGLAIRQFYSMASSETTPNMVLAGAQDNGSTMYKGETAWKNVYGGDGMKALVDYSNPNIGYVSLYYGDFFRTDDGGDTFGGSLKPTDAADGAWITPYIQHPTQPATLYSGYADVYKSTNRGSSWTKISTNLTGGGNLTFLAAAPSNGDVLYAVSGSRMWRTTNGGTAWELATKTPSNYGITSVIAHPNKPLTIWVTVSGFQDGMKCYTSDDGGKTWKNYSEGLPNVPANTIAMQTNSFESLYIGTDIGVFYRDNTLNKWISFNNHFPNTIVSELQVLEPLGLIRAATYGRGVWECSLFEPVSVGEESPAAECEVRPNPNQGTFAVKANLPAGTVKIGIKSMLGITAQEEMSQHAGGEFLTNINIQALPAGAYLLELSVGKKTIRRKIIRE